METIPYALEHAQALGEMWPLSGAHILHLYLNEIERRHVLLDFIADGLARGERICVVHDRPIEDLVAGFGLGPAAPGPRPRVLPCPAPPADAAAGPPVAADRFLSDTSRNFYLGGGVFDHHRIYRQWQEFYRTSRQAGYHACRALGEVLPDLQQVGDGQVLVLYEANLKKVLEASPLSCVVCQYDSRAFRGDALLATLRVHPLVLVESRVLANPFFEPDAGVTSH
jgi:hypothetical protein